MSGEKINFMDLAPGIVLKLCSTGGAILRLKLGTEDRRRTPNVRMVTVLETPIPLPYNMRVCVIPRGSRIAVTSDILGVASPQVGEGDKVYILHPRIDHDMIGLVIATVEVIT